MGALFRRHRLALRLALPIAACAAAVVSAGPAAAQQPCNPLIDGTYCATQMPKGSLPSSPSRVRMAPIEDIGSAISTGSHSPATLGGISIRGGGTTCIGLLRRGACN